MQKPSILEVKIRPDQKEAVIRGIYMIASYQNYICLIFKYKYMNCSIKQEAIEMSIPMKKTTQKKDKVGRWTTAESYLF